MLVVFECLKPLPGQPLAILLASFIVSSLSIRPPPPHTRRCCSKGSNGGALEVEQGGAAYFTVPVHFKGNSVAPGFSGGALHADGDVSPATAEPLLLLSLPSLFFFFFFFKRRTY